MASHIGRRKFLATLGGAAAWAPAARAQQARDPIIGFLGGATRLVESQRVAAFVQRLHQLGWIENRNVTIEYRWAEGRAERFTELAAELASTKGRSHRCVDNSSSHRCKAGNIGHRDRDHDGY